ncbi:MAG: adenylyl-sulfate kinase, partial [Candidatus Omnitrophica bacterium]|nr:adenylyl-sulfate kinase [Candidatus Omnitrophota bacterium]
LAVLINKMDLCDYARERFDAVEREYRAFLTGIGLEPMCFIPISARHGDNIAALSTRMSWWNGPTVVRALDEFKVADPPENQSLRFAVQDVYRFDERRILAGRIERGTLRVGDRLLFSPGTKTSGVRTIERWNVLPRDFAVAGESIGITLTEQVFVQRGAIAALETDAPYELTSFKARLFWLGRAPFRKGRLYKLKLSTQEAECEIETIERVIDPSTLETVSRKEKEILVGRNEVAELILRTRRPVAFDTHAESPATGRFVIVDGYEVAGGGVILDDHYPRRSLDHVRKEDSIFWSQGKVTAEQRAHRNGHPGYVVWLTGLSGAGKSTIACNLERELFNLGKQAYVLDGDNIRHGLCADLAFAPRDRVENIRRVGELAKLFADAGFIVITAFISPYRADRELVRKLLSMGRFVEVYINAPLQVCERRDPKGLYKKARANEIKEFTGISAPYETPLSPEIELRTDQFTVEESVARIIECLHLQDADMAISI